MSKFIIQGGKRLEGEVKISGSKNAALPIIASTILIQGKTILYNVPNIQDVQTMFEIIKDIGGKVTRKKNKIIIDTRKIHTYKISDELMRKMRSSVILAGAIMGKYHKARFSYPGGCDIGARPIDLHLESFKKLGVNIEEKAGFIVCRCDKIVGANIDLDFPSVGATENIILASVYAEGITKVSNAAMEPEIVDLADCLNKMGAKIEGAGTNIIQITGVKKLKDISYTVMPDRIEAGTLLCMAAATGGKVKLTNMVPEHISPVLNKLKECGCKIEETKNTVYIDAPKRLKAVDIKTMPYPGFPTDMQSVFTAITTTAKGTSIIVENIFENRYKFVQELVRMGAKTTIEGRTAVVKGVRKLSGATVMSTDLRGGAALVVAGLMAKSKSKIIDIEYILRGYENLDQKLRKLGANINKEEGD